MNRAELEVQDALALCALVVLVALMLFGCSNGPVAPAPCTEDEESYTVVAADSVEIVICDQATEELKMCVWSGNLEIVDRDLMILMCRLVWEEAAAMPQRAEQPIRINGGGGNPSEANSPEGVR